MTPRAGFVLTDVVSDVDATEERGVVKIRIPELLADEVRSVVLEGRLEARPAPGAHAETVAVVAAAYDTYVGGRPVRGSAALEAKVSFVPEADAQPKPTRSVDAIVAVAQLVRAQIDAEEAAQRGQHGQAREVMVLFQAAVASRGHVAVASAAEKIADRVADPEAFRGSSAYRSSMRKGGTRAVVTLYQSEAAADLGSMGQAKTTLAQERMVDSFRGRASRRRLPRRGGA